MAAPETVGAVVEPGQKHQVPQGDLMKFSPGTTVRKPSETNTLMLKM